MRVWDYFIKPVSVDELAASIAELPETYSGTCTQRPGSWLAEPVLPAGSSPLRANMHKTSTALALSYVRQQYHNKITLDDVASLCGMSKSHFSRTFRNEHGVTFQEFLIQQRINKAVELLGNSDLQVTQVALAVGFTELSNFTRTFRRTIGMLPSCYRKALAPKHLKKTVVGQSVKFPLANPNPVLSTNCDGVMDFLNPAVLHLLDELRLARVEDMLPRAHNELLKACSDSDTVLTDERKVGSRTFAWSYHKDGVGDLVYIYGHDVSGYISRPSRTEALSGINANPVFSSIPDGSLRFINPAVSLLLKEFELETAKDILPDNHDGLIKACRKTGATLTQEWMREGRAIEWSYHPMNDSNEVYIYGHDVSGLQ
jgi:AraC-like DNA-binding protein